MEVNTFKPIIPAKSCIKPAFGSRFYFSDDMNKNPNLGTDISKALNTAKDKFISSKDSPRGQNKFNMAIGVSYIVPDDFDSYFEKSLTKEKLRFEIRKDNEYFPSKTSY